MNFLTRLLHPMLRSVAGPLAILHARFQAKFGNGTAPKLKWVGDEQAREITGLSRRSLLRERQKPDSIIIYKEDRGMRYQYDSLIAHNASRALGRARLS